MTSYVDLRTFLRVIDARHKISPRGAVNAFPAPRRDYESLLESVGAAIRREVVISRAAHENYHFLQHAWLPYLYVHAAAVWKTYVARWDSLGKIKQTFDWRLEPFIGQDPWMSFYAAIKIRNLHSQPEPLRPMLDLDEIVALPDRKSSFDELLRYFESQQKWWQYFNQAVSREDAEPTDPLRTVSPWEMMEGSASHFEYRLATLNSSSLNHRGDAAGFDRWSVEVGAYRNVYDLCLEFMDPDIAFKMLPMIITAAFHTTNPVLFVDNLLQSMTLWPVKRLRELPDRALYAAIMSGIRLKTRTFEFDDPEWILDPAQEIEEVRLISDDQLDGATWGHPLLKRFRHRRREILEADPAMADFAALPFYRDRLQYLNAFVPPITMCLIDEGDASDSWSLAPIVDQEIVTQDLLNEILVQHAAFDALDELAGRVSTQPHMCPWTDCRFHKTRLCRGNFNSPTAAHSPEVDCWFPKYLAMADKQMAEPYVLSRQLKE